MPYDSKLDDGSFRSQPDRVCLDRNACIPVADALRLVPCEQQLHAQLDGLLRLSPGSFPEHSIARRKRTEPRCGRIPNHGGAVRIVSPDYNLGCGSLQSQYNRFPAAQCPRDSCLQFVPRWRQLHFDDHPQRLREFRVPSNDLAADQQSGALDGGCTVRGRELFGLPFHRELDDGSFRSQHDGVCLDWVARFTVADPLRVVPCEQQLHADLNSLLRLPRRCLAKHCDARRRGAESHYRGVPTRLLTLPYDLSLDRRGI